MTGEPEFTLAITFRHLPAGHEVRLLEATLPSGAKFILDAAHIPGKLGANLQLFSQGAKAAASPSGTQNAITAHAPIYDEDRVQRVAAGRAFGVDTTADAVNRRLAKIARDRETEDFLSSLQIDF